MSKKTLIIIVGCILAIILFIFFNSTSANLTGRWELAEGSRGFEYIEFFDNDTYKSSHSNYEGSYSITGDRILLQGDLMDDIVFTFKRQGNTLKFFNKDGELYSVFEKQ